MNDETPTNGLPSREPTDAESALDDWVHAYCDEETDRGAPVELPADPVMRLQAADHCWLDVLLDRMLRRDASGSAGRVKRVLSAIDDEVPEPFAAEPAPTLGVRLFRREWLSFSWAVAVAIVACAMIWVWKNGPQQVAYADVRESLQEAEQPKDRQYRITTHLENYEGEQLDVVGELYVRGGKKFALKHTDFSNVEHWFGSNGLEGWYSSETEENRTCNGVARLLDWARDEGVALPDLQLTALLSRFAHEYELRRLPSETIDGDTRTSWKRVRGVRIAEEGHTPDVLELWAHPESGVARRFVLVWDPPLGTKGLTAITLDLVGEEPMADSWYKAATHSP